MHRSGVPEDRLGALHDALEQGHYVVILRLATDEVARWQQVLDQAGAATAEDYPYRGPSDVAS
jgi:hypothetical protein